MVVLNDCFNENRQKERSGFHGNVDSRISVSICLEINGPRACLNMWQLSKTIPQK